MDLISREEIMGLTNIGESQFKSFRRLGLIDGYVKKTAIVKLDEKMTKESAIRELEKLVARYGVEHGLQQFEKVWDNMKDRLYLWEGDLIQYAGDYARQHSFSLSEQRAAGDCDRFCPAVAQGLASHIYDPQRPHTVTPPANRSTRTVNTTAIQPRTMPAMAIPSPDTSSGRRRMSLRAM